MRCRLTFPEAAVRRLKELGFRQQQTERLRWTRDHPASHYGQGVLLRGKSAELLDGEQFRRLRDLFGARIETDDQAKTARALGVPWQADIQEPGIEPWPESRP